MSLFKGSIAGNQRHQGEMNGAMQKKLQQEKFEDRRNRKQLWESTHESRIKYSEIKKKLDRDRVKEMYKVPSSRRHGQSVPHFVQEL